MARLRFILLFVGFLQVAAGPPLSAQVDDPDRGASRIPPGSLEGMVWESTRATPLPLARVALLRTDYSTHTDSAGHFAFERIPPGSYSVVFNHPRLDSLAAFPRAVEVEVPPGGTAEVTLGVPTLGSILATVCALQRQPAGTSPLVGTVRTHPDGGRVPRARVRVRWAPDERRPEEAEPESPLWMEARTDAAGRYALCGVPADREVSVRAFFFSQEGRPETVRLSPEDHTVLDLSVSFPPGFVIARTGASILAEGAGTQGVQGFVREPGSGAPVRNVEVTLRQTPGTIIITGETSSRGFFRLRTPIPGTYALEARAMGFGEATAENLVVEEGRLVVLDIEMAPAPLELEPMVAQGQPRVFQLEVQGFYDRKEEGGGYFITPEELQRWAPASHAQIFRRIPGIRVLDGAGFGTRLVMHRPNLQDGPVCTPRLYVDGGLVRTSRVANNLEARGVVPDDIVSIRDLEAIEFYPGPSSVPLVWGGMTPGRCGTIVMWTKMG